MSKLVKCSACENYASAWFSTVDGEEVPLCQNHQPSLEASK